MNSKNSSGLANRTFKVLLLLGYISFLGFSIQAQNSVKSSSITAPLRLGIIGLKHDHVHGVFQNYKSSNIDIVGIVEPDTAVAARYIKRYHLDPALIYKTIDELITKTKPEAVSVFTPISEHINVVRICAPHKIHVMVEKPLAINYQQAIEMKTLAEKSGIFLITNYETTWYPVTKDSYHKINDDKLIGDIRKMVIHDGHNGPIEINCSKDFTNWLTDPKQNGGGAIIDFGCYGTDLMTYLMKGERPVSVTAITQQIKPDVYPNVDDEATIIVTYPKAQGIIQASWNWPFGRKDMEIYGKTGYLITTNSDHMRIKANEKQDEQLITIDADKAIARNAFSFFASVVRGEYKLTPTDPSSLNLNITAMEILDAAVRSAATGKTIFLK